MLSEFISGALGAIIGVGIGFLTLRYNYKDLYARNISANRMEWINCFREEISIVVATLKMLSNDSNNIGGESLSVFEAEKARAKLLTRLNMDISKFGNEYNEVMANILTEIDFSKSYAIKECCEKNLIELSRKILESEWQRVKREAGGDKN